MTITIEIKCDNAAFEDNEGREVARILRRLATLCEEHGIEAADGNRLMDFNGNHVGGVTIDN